MATAYDDDSEFEVIRGIDGRPVRVLKDGGRVRISMAMRDSMLREDRRSSGRKRKYDPQGREQGSEEWEEETDDAMLLHDGRGGRPGHRPGFAITSDAAVRSAKLRAYRDYDADLTSAWRHPTADGEGYDPEDIGEPCTCKGEDFPADFGSPGTIRRVGSRIICVPNKRRSAPDPASDHRSVADMIKSHQARMRDVYARYDHIASNSWRQDPE
jgi:hypothetical protein